jgi:hypothetical protein
MVGSQTLGRMVWWHRWEKVEEEAGEKGKGPRNLPEFK